MLPLRSFRAAGSGAWAARGAGWAASPLCAPLRAAPPSPAAAAATLRTAARLVHSGVLRARSGGRAPVALSLPRSCGGARSSLARSPLRVFLRRNASKEGAEKSAPPRRLCRPPVCASQPPRLIRRGCAESESSAVVVQQDDFSDIDIARSLPTYGPVATAGYSVLTGGMLVFAGARIWLRLAPWPAAR